MGVDPLEAMREEFLKKPRREQLDILVRATAPGASSVWLTRDVAQTLLMRFLVESSERLEAISKALVRLTVWLVILTGVLGVLTGVLAYDVVRRLTGN